MSRNDEVRKSVSDFYAQAVKAATGCGCGCGCGDADPAAGFAAGFDGYSQELPGLPEDAVRSSFGCGNPLAFSEVRPGEVVLDLGSGAGLDLLVAARKVGPSGRVIGVDMTDEMITRARANAAGAGFGNIEVRKGIIEDLPVDSSSVDWVISNCVINLSPEKDRVFAEIARVLKPGGRMQVSDIVVQDLPSWARDSIDLYASCVSGAVSQDEYTDGLRSAGLVDVEIVERFPFDPFQGQADTDLAAPEAEPTSCCGSGASCCGVPDPAADMKVAAAAIRGKVFSVRVHARKSLSE
jgi:SAM-dependent methyltransferase